MPADSRLNAWSGRSCTSGWLASEHAQIVAGIVFFALVTGGYTIYGGLRSAAWTDFMQIIILGIGGVLVPILGLRAVGGLRTVVHDDPMRFQVFLPVSHEKFPFTGVFTGFLTVGIWYTCTSQHMVQRVLAAKDEWNARMGVIGAGFLHIVTPFFFVFPGFLAYKILGPELLARGCGVSDARPKARLARPARPDPRRDGGGADEQPFRRPQLRFDSDHARLL